VMIPYAHLTTDVGMLRDMFLDERCLLKSQYQCLQLDCELSRSPGDPPQEGVLHSTGGRPEGDCLARG